MFDVTGPKVLIPSILFGLLNPGLLVAFPRDAKLPVQAVFHGLIFSIFYFLICKYVARVTLTKADMIVPTILFIVMTPEVFFSVPPHGGPTAVMTHALLFAIIFAFVRGIFPEYY
jgi:hypothetical protein